MKLQSITVGTRYFNETPVTATDPCYTKGTWCTLSDIQVKPGEYECVAFQGEDSYFDKVAQKTHTYHRIFKCAIYHSSMDKEDAKRKEYLGEIGVDAGLAGFFQNKPDYTDEEWDELCDEVNQEDYLITKHGFFTESGYGDGEYPVYAYYNQQGEIVSLAIDFI